MKQRLWFFFAGSIALLLGWPSMGFSMQTCARLGTCAQPVKTMRFALIIGNNDAGGRARSLQFAELDARKMRDLLVQLAGYQAKDIWLLQGRSAGVVKRTMKSIDETFKRLRKRHGKRIRIVLFLYYSGHVQNGHLLLGRSSLSFRLLKSFMRRVSASLRLAVFDSCESGVMARTKGLKRRKTQFRFPVVRLAPSARGEVIISATGARENAHEDTSLRGGIFTHYFLSGLRGAADRNQDGHVTLEEAYLYSYNRSLERTILSSRGPQRARFRKTLSGYGSLILTRLSKQRAWLKLRKQLSGDFFIWNTKRDLLLAEVIKNKGQSVTVALPPGRYRLQWRRRGGVYHKEITLKQGQRFSLGQVGNRLAYRRTNTRGAQADAWQSFDGQLVGTGLGLSYRAGYSGLERGLFHHGGTLHLIQPIADGRLSLLFQLGYQYGYQMLSEKLKFDLHLGNVDLGVLWTLLERPHWWIGGGGLLRVNLIAQALYPRSGEEPEQAKEALLSFGFGVAGALMVQYGFAQRWFVQLSLIAGPRILNLGGIWSVRWDLEAGLGVGIRF